MGQTVKEDEKSEDFSSSSTFEMDQSAAQSQKSISSIGISNQPSDPQTNAASQIDHPEFVNHGKFVVIYAYASLIRWFYQTSTYKHQKILMDHAGLTLWNQTRQQWIENRRSQSQTQVREPIIR